MTFGQRIKQLRQERGLSQEELGKLVGVSSRVLGYYEADERFPRSRETLLAFAQAFQVSLDYLLDNPVRTEGSGCPSRFCYMKSMSPEQRAAVNEFIGYLRYRGRKDAEEQEARDNAAGPYADSKLSPDIIAMIEEWKPADEEAAPEEEIAVEEEEIPAEAEEIPVETEEIPVETEAPDEEEIPAEDELPAEEEAPVEEDELPADEESLFEEDVTAEEDDYSFSADDVPAKDDMYPFGEVEIPAGPFGDGEIPAEPFGVADPEAEFAREAAADEAAPLPQSMQKFFENDYFVDDFFENN